MGPKADDVREIVTKLRGLGMMAGLRDVSFAVLSRIYGDPQMAYRSIFGDSPEMDLPEYSSQAHVSAVAAQVDKFFYPDEGDADESGQSLSFDDLKQGLIDDMNALIELRDKRTNEGGPMLEPKEMAQVVARIADIRVKLTEKFNTTEHVVEQRVIVENKFDTICPVCHHEISVDPSLFEKE